MLTNGAADRDIQRPDIIDLTRMNRRGECRCDKRRNQETHGTPNN